MIISVTAITLLVWLWAEGQIIKENRLDDLRVDFVAPTGEMLRIDPAGVNVRVDYKASASRITGLERALGERNNRIQVTVNEGDTAISLQQAIQLNEVFDNLGIVVDRVDPETEKIDVVKLVTVKDVPVKADWTGKASFAEQPTVDPNVVSVTLPEADVSVLNGYLPLKAELLPSDWQGAAENEKQTVDVKITMPYVLENNGAVVNPSTVSVAFTVKKQTATFVIKTVPIYISAPPTSLDQYKVQLGEGDQDLQDVRLDGPEDLIEQIKKGEIKIFAEIRPTKADLEGGIKYATPVLVKPDQVEVKSHVPQVPVTVIPREGS